MANKAAQLSVQAWEGDGLLLEQYAYTAGAVEPLPRHTHEEYQFGLSFNCQGEYHYRGAYSAIPAGSLSVIQAGEVHVPSERTELSAPAHFAMMHIRPTWLQTLAAEMTERPASLPFFSTVCLTDATLNHLFLALQAAAAQRTSKLQQDVALWGFLSYLMRHYATNRPSVCLGKPAPKAVTLALEYLHAHYTNAISLEALAASAGLSRFHFCRVFRQALGVSPNVYQTQLRIAQAKKLLRQGIPVAVTAAMTGFYDQSHLSWQFKRQVGVTPRRYVSKSAIIS